MAKVKELQGEKGSTPEQRYRDRAMERRSHFGYDPGLIFVVFFVIKYFKG